LDGVTNIVMGGVNLFSVADRAERKNGSKAKKQAKVRKWTPGKTIEKQFKETTLTKGRSEKKGDAGHGWKGNSGWPGARAKINTANPGQGLQSDEKT